ncbi:MAG: ATP-binding protein [Chloroflexi bacterium]|nr:ATP-binding protein [Chloroflexota bacterium]
MNGIHPWFVDREEELERIRAHVEAWDTTRILVIDGPGGVGKTRLLEEVHRQRLAHIEFLRGQSITTEVINLADVRFQMPMNLARRIALELDPQRFQHYLEETDRIVREESKGLLTLEALERYIHESDKLFLQAYNDMAREKRVLLLIDTVEAILSLPVGRYLAKIVSQLKNTCVLIAGREGMRAKELIEQALKRTQQQASVILDYLLLKNFKPETSAEYLDKTPVKGYLEAHPRLRQNLLFLTEGKPLLLALAVEWLLRDMPLPELLKQTPKKLQALGDKEKKDLRERFEAALITHIRYLRDPGGDLILDMAHLYYRFDPEVLSAITGWPEEKSQEQLSRMRRDLFFVKAKPGDILVLHDEVARLVREYVWPQLDPFGTRRQELSRMAVEHYRNRLERLEKRMQEAQEEALKAEEKGNLAKASEAWRCWAEKRREQWVLVQELLHYTLEVDLKAGYNLFVEKFDQATDKYQLLLRSPLVEEIANYEEKFAGDEKYEVGIRIAKCLLDETEYQDAYEKAKALLEAFPYQDHRRVDTIIQLANNAARMGRLEEGRQYFEEALRLCKEYQLPDKKWWAMAENGLGWAYRVLGQWDEAIQHWQTALDYSVEVGDRKRMASILNNLGYVYHLKGGSRSGLALSQQALEIAQSLGFGRQIAMNHSTLGEIHLALDRYEEAFAHYREALALFEGERDEEWMAIVYHELSRAKRHQAFDEEETPIRQQKERLEEALRYAERSLQLCTDYHLSKELPAAYYGIGSIEADLGQIEKAKSYLQESYNLNKERGELFGLMVDLAALAELAYMEQDMEKVRELAQEARQLQSTGGGKVPANYPLFFGRTLRTLAEAYLEQKNYEQALDTYIEALTHIGRHGGYGKYRFDRELKKLRKRMSEVPSEIRASWCERFIKQWQAKPDLAREHPEVITTCLLVKWSACHNIGAERE